MKPVGENSIQSQTSRTFYKSQTQSLSRSSFLSHNATVSIFGDEPKPSGRSLHFTCNALKQGKQANIRFKMPPAIIGLVCPEARVKFKNIDFWTEADFACYCITMNNTESIESIYRSNSLN